METDSLVCAGGLLLQGAITFGYLVVVLVHREGILVH